MTPWSSWSFCWILWSIPLAGYINFRGSFGVPYRTALKKCLSHNIEIYSIPRRVVVSFLSGDSNIDLNISHKQIISICLSDLLNVCQQFKWLCNDDKPSWKFTLHQVHPFLILPFLFSALVSLLVRYHIVNLFPMVEN